MLAFRTALVTIANGDTALKALLGGRSTDNMKPWANIGALPAEGIAYQIVSEVQSPREGEQRDVVVQFSCFGKTVSKAEQIAARVTSEGASGMFTHPKFDAEGVNACPLTFSQQDATGLEEDGRKEHRIDVQGNFDVEFA